MSQKIKSFLVGLFVFAVLVGLFEAAGQIAIRYFEFKRPSGLFGDTLLRHDEPLIGFGLKKNLNEKVAGWHVRTNDLGLRGEALPVKKPSDEFRIFIVGGSTVFGWGVNEQETIAGHLQKLIQSQQFRSLTATTRSLAATNHKQVRVINAGMPWYASWHESALIFFRILALEPDWIIVFDGLNDVAASLQPLWTPIHLGGSLDLPTQIAASRKKNAARFSAFVADLIRLSPTLRYFFAKLAQRKELRNGTYHPEVWDQYIRYMTGLKHLTASLGIRFSVFLQPVMCLDKPLDPYEIQTDATSMATPMFAEMFRKVYQEGEKRLLNTRDIPFTSLRSTFSKTTSPIYMDGLHYNNLGNEMLAREIYHHAILNAVIN